MEQDDHIDSQMPPEKDRKPMPDALREELEIAATAREDGHSVEQTVQIVRSHRQIRKVLSRYPDALRQKPSESSDPASSDTRTGGNVVPLSAAGTTGPSPQGATGPESPAGDTHYRRAANTDADAVAVAKGVVLTVDAQGRPVDAYPPLLIEVRAELHRGSGFAIEIGKGINGELIKNHATEIKKIVHRGFAHLNIDPEAVGTIYISVSPCSDGAKSDEAEVIQKGDSYFLAAVMAVISAIKGWKLEEGGAFIGSEDYSDANFSQKIRFLSEQIDIHQVLVWGKAGLARQISREDTGNLKVRLLSNWMDGIGEAFGSGSEDSASAGGGASVKDKRGPVINPEDPAEQLNFLTIFMAVVLLAYAGMLPFAGNLVYPAHLMIIDYLKSDSLRLFNLAHAITVFKFLGVPCGLISLIARYGFKKKAHGRLGRAWRVVRYLGRTCPVIITILFSVYIGLMYVSPTGFERYKTIEYLKEKPFFGTLARSVPNHRHKEMRRLIGEMDYRQAVEVGIEMSPLDPEFPDDFITLTGLLMDAVQDAGQADTLMKSYERFIREIEKRADARAMVFHTLDAADQLVTKYFDGGRWPRFMVKLKKDYGVDKDGG